MPIRRRNEPMSKEFLMQRVKVDEETGCWNWILSTKPAGYGAVGWNRKVWNAHALSFHLFNGQIEKGKYVCHKCDNPRCINPDHLYAGTQLQNMRDAVNRGRLKGRRVVIGMEHPNSRLTREQVIEIRGSKENRKALAARMGVCLDVIYRVRNGTSYQDV